MFVFYRYQLKTWIICIKYYTSVCEVVINNYATIYDASLKILHKKG